MTERLQALAGFPRQQLAVVPEAVAKFTPLNVLDLKASSTLDWLVDRLVPVGEPGMIWSPDGTGKSTLLLYLCVCISSGSQFLGRHVRKGRALYVSEEDGPSRIRSRVLAIATGLGLCGDDLAGLDVIARQGVVLEDPSSQAELVELTEAGNYDLTAYDPLRDLTALDENSPTDMSVLTSLVRSITRLPNAPAVCIVHHTPVADPTRSRGTGSLRAMSRWALSVEEDKTDADLIKVSVPKLTDAKKPPPIKVRRQIQTDENHGGIWTCATFAVEDFDTMPLPADYDPDAEMVYRVAVVLKQAPRSGKRLKQAISGRDSTVDKGIKDLLTMGLAEQQGSGPKSRYVLTDAGREYIAQKQVEMGQGELL